MAASIASSSKPSPRASPSNSIQKANITLETLISYLVAAKRSLASISLVHRATNILADARSAIESTTALRARTTYLRRSLASQIKILRGVQFELERAAQGTYAEVKATLKELEATDKRLQESIQTLRDTRVEEGFKVAAQEKDEDEEYAESKETLHDFVDDKPIEDLRDSVKTALDNVEQAKQQMDQSIQSLEEDLQAINAALVEETVSSSSTALELQQPNVRRLLRTLETHAREMAQGLESLVKHFDLCVTAIKHTEGGGDAVARNVDTEDLPEGVGVEDFEAPAQPMTDEERVEMLEVLENDAAEVDDVVIELQDRNAEMEAQLRQIVMWKEKSEGSYNDVALGFELLEKVGRRISSHVAESTKYATRWAEEKAKIEAGMAGMDELREVYGNFLNAYDGLIVEVARRKTVKKQMERVVQEANAKLEKLYEDDLGERDAFRNERGDYLPSDIWHGLASLPPRFGIVREDEDGGSVPDLPKKTVEDALRRLKSGRTNGWRPT